jgi:hypothetical protein
MVTCVTPPLALCFLEWGGEHKETGGVLVAGASDGRLGFVDVCGARLLHVDYSLASCIARLLVPDGSDLLSCRSGVGSPQSNCFSIHTVVAADTVGGGTWVGALEYSDPALLALGWSNANNSNKSIKSHPVARCEQSPFVAEDDAVGGWGRGCRVAQVVWLDAAVACRIRGLQMLHI